MVNLQNYMTALTVKTSTSKGQDTRGFYTVTLTDTTTGRKYVRRSSNNGYAVARALADWIVDRHETHALLLAADPQTGMKYEVGICKNKPVFVETRNIEEVVWAIEAMGFSVLDRWQEHGLFVVMYNHMLKKE